LPLHAFDFTLDREARALIVEDRMTVVCSRGETAADDYRERCNPKKNRFHWTSSARPTVSPDPPGRAAEAGQMQVSDRSLTAVSPPMEARRRRGPAHSIA